MKKNSAAKIAALTLFATIAMSCQWHAAQYPESPDEPEVPAPEAPAPESKPETDVFTQFSEASYVSYDKATNTYTIDGTKVNGSWNFITVPLNKYGNAKIKLQFNCTMEVNNSGKDANLMWQVNVDGYPVVASRTFANGNSGKVNVSAVKELDIDRNSVFYLSTYNITPENLNIKISDFSLTVTLVQKEKPIEFGELKNWNDVPSLKDAYIKKGFDSFGFAVENFQLTNSEVQNLLRKHANTITMGNEYKFDSVFGTYANIKPNTDGKFKASSGLEIAVPTNCPNFKTVDSVLENCKKNGLKMRGHVLVWHSQTNTRFFRENYSDNGNYVSKDVMDARQEWYIKSVLEHITEWEKKNNGGKHIIWAWDVVNEAMADDANVSEGKYLRGSTNGSANSSDWYRVYKSDEYILNAFKYANKYAPNDVLLCYNDYNSYMENKTQAICTTVDRIRQTEGARIDVVGMQSHVIDDFPGAEAFDKAIKTFAAKNVDIHVTEFDLANRQQEKYSIEWNTKLYESYFKVMVDNMKKDGKRGVTSITIWGLDDQSSWLNNQYHRDTYPLLFRKVGNSYGVKQEFYNVLKVAK